MTHSIRDRYTPGYPTSVRLSGVLVEFDEHGLCQGPTPEQLEAVSSTATRRERFEVLTEAPFRRRRREAIAAPENAPSVADPAAAEESES